MIVILRFQSTPARGGRPAALDGLAAEVCFNPRPRAAGDFRDLQHENDQIVSIHARARRATDGLGCMLAGFGFQSTPARGGRRLLVGAADFHDAFQSTPARGGRLRLFGDPFQCLIVSIHARARRATKRLV